MADESFVDVAIIGAGTAGLNAMREVRRAGKSFILIDHGPLGTTCSRVGCMPSKAALHAGSIWKGRFSISAKALKPDGEARPDALWQAARKARDMLTSGIVKRTLAAAGDALLMGHARFISPDTIEVGARRVKARAFVIATGSHPFVPATLDIVQDRLFTTDTIFELDGLPQSIGVIGMGAIGLELGLALSRLGVKVIGGDLKAVPGGISDPEIAARAIAQFEREMALWLGKPIEVTSKDGQALISNGELSEPIELILAALGRRPNIEDLDLRKAGIELDKSGLPNIDPHTMQVANSRLYFAGDVSPDRPLLHEATDEGSIAGWNAARHGAPEGFHRRVPLSIIFSDPDVAFVGMTYDRLDLERTIIGEASGETNGRSRVNGTEYNFIRLYADKENGRLLGACMFSERGEHLAHLLAWAIQRGETAESLLEMPFYHPTIEEMVQSALSDIVRKLPSRKAAITGLQSFSDREQSVR